MRPTKFDIINRLNARLEQFRQTTRIITLTREEIMLANGTTITSVTGVRKFIRRISNIKHTQWVENIDKLLSNNITEAEIKSKLCSIGGAAVQEKHGEFIRNNLNIGTPWNKGTKGNYPYSHPRSELTRNKISKKNSGPGNGMFGTKMSNQDKVKKSKHMKQLIIDGKFTPNSNNRNTHWDASCNGSRYRSSWEALYAYLNETAEYETLRIPYALNGKEYVYIVDFIDHDKKIVVEVKPLELCTGEKFAAKMQALKEWATDNNYSVMVVDKKYLQQQCARVIIDYSQFDDRTSIKIKALNETSKEN
jgi:hypothetical protein